MTLPKFEYKKQVSILIFLKSLSTGTIANENIKVFHSTSLNDWIIRLQHLPVGGGEWSNQNFYTCFGKGKHLRSFIKVIVIFLLSSLKSYHATLTPTWGIYTGQEEACTHKGVCLSTHTKIAKKVTKYWIQPTVHHKRDG